MLTKAKCKRATLLVSLEQRNGVAPSRGLTSESTNHNNMEIDFLTLITELITEINSD